MAAKSRYRNLDPAQIVVCLERLERRIEERFPGAGLANVCRELVEVARETGERSRRVARPTAWLRIFSWIAIAAGAVLLTAVANLVLSGTKANDDLYGTLQGIDSGFNIVVLVGATLFFVISLEQRWKQRSALSALHDFRSIVHVIDMHQLTKDPSMMGAARTSSSPDRDLAPFELVRYLDYCSEMLSLTAKLAAVYAEKLSDPVIVDTVGDIERLTSELSAKIWQKITIVQSLEGRDIPLPPATQIGRTLS